MSIDISVIIPTFRRPRELSEAIASVLSQTGVAVEVIVIDDSPEASAQGVVGGIGDPRVRYLKSPMPSGGMPSAVRNLGWPLARGALIHFLDDDDIVPEGHYAIVMKVFSEHAEAGVVFGRIEPFGDAPAMQMQHERVYFSNAASCALLCSRFGPKWGFTAAMLFRDSMLICSACVVRRECVEQVGGFDPRMRLGEDADFYTFAIRNSGARFINRVSLRFRVSNPSMMHSIALDPRQTMQLIKTRQLTYGRYRAERGTLEFYAMKAFARTVLGGHRVLMRAG
jgi:glycosyltransferase involved in cell wall biosynthesis